MLFDIVCHHKNIWSDCVSPVLMSITLAAAVVLWSRLWSSGGRRWRVGVLKPAVGDENLGVSQERLLRLHGPKQLSVKEAELTQCFYFMLMNRLYSREMCLVVLIVSLLWLFKAGCNVISAGWWPLSDARSSLGCWVFTDAHFLESAHPERLLWK